MKRLYLILAMVIIGASGFLGGLMNVEMVEAQSLLQVSPVNDYVIVAVGQETLLPYKLVNISEREIEVRMEACSFEPDDLYGQPLLIDELEFPWIELAEASSGAIKLRAGEEREVMVRLNPPAGTAEKEYPLTLLFNFTQEALTNNVSQVNLQMGSNLIVAIGNPDDYGVNLAISPLELSIVNDTFSENKFQLLAQNLGGYGSLINGVISIKDFSGAELWSWETYPDLILGQSERLVRGKVENEAGQISLTDEFVLPNNLLGIFNISFALNGETEAVWEQTIYFLPVYIAIIVGGVIIVALVIIVIAKQGKRKAKHDKLSEEMDLRKAQRDYFETKK